MYAAGSETTSMYLLSAIEHGLRMPRVTGRAPSSSFPLSLPRLTHNQGSHCLVSALGLQTLTLTRCVCLCNRVCRQSPLKFNRVCCHPKRIQGRMLW